MATRTKHLDTARNELDNATAAYEQAQLSLGEAAQHQLPERVVIEEERHELLASAAKRLVAAIRKHDELAAQDTARRQADTRQVLADLDGKITVMAAQAEEQADALFTTLTDLIAGGRERYVAVKDRGGSAGRMSLLRTPISKWLFWRMSLLDLPDAHAPVPFRRPLGELVAAMKPVEAITPEEVKP